MPIGSSFTFRVLLDSVKYAIFAVDGLREIFRSVGRRVVPQREWHPLVVPDLGESVRIRSGNRNLEAWFVAPMGSIMGSVLLCHGIGDRITYWRRVQERLALAGYSSLVFHYSGYGASGGATTPENLSEDATSAYAWLRGRGASGLPCFVLGFSLGSGLAAQVADSLRPLPSGLILCEAFPSLREAARRIGRSLGFLAVLLPDIWLTRRSVTRLQVPLLVVHSSGDRLFPVAMAEEIYNSAVASGRAAELRVLLGYPHNAPYLWVPEDYWAVVLDFMARIGPNSVSG